MIGSAIHFAPVADTADVHGLAGDREYDAVITYPNPLLVGGPAKLAPICRPRVRFKLPDLRVDAITHSGVH